MRCFLVGFGSGGSAGGARCGGFPRQGSSTPGLVGVPSVFGEVQSVLFWQSRQEVALRLRNCLYFIDLRCRLFANWGMEDVWVGGKSRFDWVMVGDNGR